MFIRNVGLASALVVVAAAAFPAAAAAQDAAAVLQEVQKSIGKDVPRSVRVTAAGSGYKAGSDGARQQYRIEEQTLNADAAADAAWTTPLGFLAAAAAGQATAGTETLFGTTYRVVTFTTAQAQQVRGYINEQQELERIRTQVQDGRTKTAVETVFMAWQDFNGVKYPSLIIHKTNDQVSRILVVSRVEPAGSNS